MSLNKQRAKSGDILEVRLPGNFAYLQYLGKHLEYGDCIRVSPALHEHRAPISSELFNDAYIAFYPAIAACKEKLVQIVGNLSPPHVPTCVRRPGVRVGRHVETWIIESGLSETIKSELSDDERLLPIAAIWSHELLVLRLLEGWRPEKA